MFDFETVLNSQREFFRARKTQGTAFRKESLRKLKQMLKSNETLLCEAIRKDFGKSAFETYATELGIVYAEIDYFLKHLGTLAKPSNRKTNLENLPGRFLVCPEPLGNCLVIGAWNYPYQLCLVPLVDAIAAGNTCIVKPSELPENTMRLLSELLQGTFPSDFIFVAEGGVPETTDLLRLPFDKIFFTGSPKVGRIVYEAAAKNMVPVTLEMGGKSPAIVTASADLKVAAKRIVWGKFLNAGQTCVAPDYLYVEEKCCDELLRLICREIEKAHYSDGADNYVRIINRKNFERIVELMDSSKIFCGGCT